MKKSTLIIIFFNISLWSSALPPPSFRRCHCQLIYDPTLLWPKKQSLWISTTIFRLSNKTNWCTKENQKYLFKI